MFRVNGRLKNENIADIVKRILRQKYQDTEMKKIGCSYKSNKKLGIDYMKIS